MYALERNAWKYVDRDKRHDKFQLLESDYLAPDSINEMFDALKLLEKFTGKAWFEKQQQSCSENECLEKGRELLHQKNNIISELEIIADRFENAKRKTIITKVQQAYDAYKEMILYYGLKHLIALIDATENINQLKEKLPVTKRTNWLSIGGQLMPEDEVEIMKNKIKQNEIKSWDELHAYYKSAGEKYQQQKLQHALSSLFEIENVQQELSTKKINEWLNEAVSIQSSITEKIKQSRKKDYTNPFRRMVYNSREEMDNVVGDFDDNSFIKQKQKELESFKLHIKKIKANLNSNKK